MLRRFGRWVWGVPALCAALWWQAGVALAASGFPTVQYGTPQVSGINQPLENLAADIRYILGGTALVALLAAALVNHFVVDSRAKERAKEIAGAAILGLVIAAFAPQIVNWFGSL